MLSCRLKKKQNKYRDPEGHRIRIQNESPKQIPKTLPLQYVRGTAECSLLQRNWYWKKIFYFTLLKIWYISLSNILAFYDTQSDLLHLSLYSINDTGSWEVTVRCRYMVLDFSFLQCQWKMDLSFDKLFILIHFQKCYKIVL